VCFPEIEKNVCRVSLVLNLFASQMGEFFLPHPVLRKGKEEEGPEMGGKNFF